MTTKQAEILGRFCVIAAKLAAETLLEFAENEEQQDQVSIATRSERPARPERELLNKKQLAERLNISPRLISSLQKDGLPIVKIKKRVLFDYEKVLLWIDPPEIKYPRIKAA